MLAFYCISELAMHLANVRCSDTADGARNLKPLVQKDQPGSLAFLNRQAVDKLVQSPFSPP